MEAAINVPEQEIRYFSENMPVEVSYWAEPQLITHGRVREIAGAADPASRTFSVKVSLTPDSRIRLGQTATVSAQLPIHPSGPTLPLSALVQHDGQMAVWVIDPATETVHARVVETGTTAGEGIVIAKGLVQGEWVVTAGTQFLVDGQKIKAIKTNLAQANPSATAID